MKGKNWLFPTEKKIGHNLNEHKKNCRRFAEKNSWERNFMCGQDWVRFKRTELTKEVLISKVNWCKAAIWFSLC